MVPLFEDVRSVTDRLLAVCLDVIECGIVHRVEGGVAEAQREVSLRLSELDSEGVVIHNLQAFHLLHTLGVALDGLEEGRCLERILHSVVPRLNEVLSLHRGTVRELSVLAKGNGVLLGVLGLDLLCDLVVLFALRVVVDETRVEHVDRATATVFSGVCRNEGVLGFRTVDDDVVVATARAAVTRASCETEHQRCGHRDCQVLLHRHVDAPP